MTPLSFTFYTFGLSIIAGLLGSLLGLGGGIIVVPALTLLLHVDIHKAIGASIVSVIATSSGSAASYVKEHMSNIRLSMVLEMATTVGALSGAYLAGILQGKWLYIIFAVIMGYAAVHMILNAKRKTTKPLPNDSWANKLDLHGHYFDQAENRTIEYRVGRTKIGLFFSYIAGIISGLLGIGGGAIKVPTMNLAMGVPIKAATATSNFMIGVTAAASAGVYFVRGDIDPFIAAPVAAGVLCGATLGSKLLGRIHSYYIRYAFVVVLFYICWEMLRKGLG